jgi:hypothetical protein
MVITVSTRWIAKCATPLASSGEPARIAVISSDGKTVYEALFMSEKPITDGT